MSDRYNEEDLYADVLEQIKSPDIEAVYLDRDSYRMGFSAKRIGNTLHWSGGGSISIRGMGDGEIKFLMDMPYDMAALVV